MELPNQNVDLIRVLAAVTSDSTGFLHLLLHPSLKGSRLSKEPAYQQGLNLLDLR